MALTAFHCPYCKTSLGLRSGMRETVADIGPSQLVCPGCKKTVVTGSKEWSEMTAADRAKVLAEVYLYNGAIVGPLAAVAAWWLMARVWSMSDALSIFTAFATWCAIMLRAHRVHRREVMQSEDRERSK